MALLISHRGNLNGINNNLENTKQYIDNALNKGYYVLVDVFLIGSMHLALGIDNPVERIELEFLKQLKIIVRTKDIKCFQFLLENKIHCFYQDFHSTTLTNGGLIWTSNSNILTKKCIYAMPEWNLEDINICNTMPCSGICSNFIEKILLARVEHHFNNQTSLDAVLVIQKYIRSKLHNYFATIPEDVKHIIEIFDQDLDSVYLRKGMTNTQNSFLECVMEAMNVTIKKRSLLDQTRMKFNNNKCASCCKQEMYDFTIEEIIEYINDTSRYFSPNYFINLLECVFKCNIFIFDRNSMNSPITKLIIPRHKQSYYKRNKKGPCIFIYQHMGSLGNSVKDLPIKCELIVKKKKSDPDYIQKIFPESDILSKNINSIFNELNLTYSLYRINLNNIIPTELYELMLSQYIDSYGKTRILVINYNGIKLYLQTSPLQPFLLNSVHSSYVEPTEANIAKEFIKEYGVFDVKQIIYQKNVVAYEGVLGNVKIIIPILKTYPTIDLLQINVNNIPYNINKKESI